MTSSRTAKAAESHFATLCNLSKATANPSIDDQNGWDFFVEFDSPEISGPPDLSPALTTAFVQIKSSKTKTRSCYVKISNALKLAQNDRPCFIILMVFENESEPPSQIYVRHIWTKDIADALKRSRETFAAGKLPNQSRMQIKFDTVDRRDPKNVVSFMVAEINQVGATYAQQKRKLLEILGYEEGAVIGAFALADGVTPDEVAALHSGEIDRLPVKIMSLRETRFGVTSPEIPIGAGSISIVPERVGECIIVLRHQDGSGEISWPGILYRAALPGAPLEFRRLRAVAGPITVVVPPTGELTFSCDFDVDQLLDPAEMSRQLVLRSWSQADALEFELWIDGQPAITAAFHLNQDLSDTVGWGAMGRAFNTILGITAANRIPSTLLISTEMVLAERHELFDFAAHLTDGAAKIAVTFTDEVNEEITQTAHLVTPVAYEFAQHLFFAIVGRKVTAVKLEGKLVRFSTCTAKVLLGAILKGCIEDHQEFISCQMAWAHQKADASGGLILVQHPTFERAPDA